MVLAEAMERSLPVVAFRISSNPELIEDGKTGFMVDYPDIHEMARVTQLLIEDRALRLEMGDAGRDRVKLHFDENRRFEELLDYLKKTT